MFARHQAKARRQTRASDKFSTGRTADLAPSSDVSRSAIVSGQSPAGSRAIASVDWLRQLHDKDAAGLSYSGGRGSSMLPVWSGVQCEGQSSASSWIWV